MIKEVIHNYTQLQSAINAYTDVYCLLYKPGIEISNCANDRIGKASEKEGRNGMLCTADVSKVRDIHPVYNVTSTPTLLVFKNGKLINQVKGCNDTGFYQNLIKGSYFVGKQTGDDKQKNVTVYTSPTCTYCNSLKTYLQKNQVHFREVDISKNPEQAQQLVSRTGQQGVPQTEINGKFVVGFDTVKLNQLLEIQN
jgi:glutaredoxin-like YruB-family protein